MSKKRFSVEQIINHLRFLEDVEDFPIEQLVFVGASCAAVQPLKLLL